MTSRGDRVEPKLTCCAGSSTSGISEGGVTQLAKIDQHGRWGGCSCQGMNGHGVTLSVEDAEVVRLPGDVRLERINQFAGTL